MPGGKPNILVIWGDDIGMWNVGAYTHGMIWNQKLLCGRRPLRTNETVRQSLYGGGFHGRFIRGQGKKQWSLGKSSTTW